MPGDSQDVSMINFTWKVTSLENDIMEIKLDFENPLYISSGYVNKTFYTLQSQDRLYIEFVENIFFQDKNTKSLIQKGYTISKFIPKQMDGNSIIK